MFHLMVKSCVLGALIAAAAANIGQAAPLRTNCGAPVQSIVLTQTQSAPHFQTTSTSFTRLTGAALNVVVPAGTTRCVKVRLAARASCQGNGGNATCYLRAVANNVEMSPGAIGDSDVRFSYEWVTRLNPGTHLVQIQARRVADNAGAIIRVDDWVMDLEVLR